MSALFEPFQLRDVTLRNRIVVPPMCQYSAIDGLPNEWHHVHLSELARGGAGLVIGEATAVSPEGRITPGDTGLWNDRQAEAFGPIVRSIQARPCRAQGQRQPAMGGRRPYPRRRPARLADDRPFPTSVRPAAVVQGPPHDDDCRHHARPE